MSDNKLPASVERSEIQKGTRHQKVIGQLGEQLVYNWLSRSGFEASIIDHTGIDIIAFDPVNKRRLGISVKARTRGRKAEKWSVTIFQKKDDREKTVAACAAFDCEAWIGVYIEATEFADLYLVSLQELDRIYQAQEGAPVRFWRMIPKYCAAHNSNPNLLHIRIAFDACNWRFTVSTPSPR